MRIVFVAVVACALLPRVAESQRSCESTFHGSGTLINRTYSVYIDAPDLQVSDAVARLNQQLPPLKFAILSTDAEHGVVKATGTEMRETNFDFVATATAGGVRVKMVMHPPAVVYAVPTTRNSMCSILTSALAAPAQSNAEVGGKATSAGSSAPAPEAEPPSFEPSEPPLTNDEVIKLSEAGLGSDLIIAKIKQAANEALDVSTDALLALKKKKVAHDVIAAMIQRVADRKQAPPN
jgi:hypothetical protein